jgi:NADPH2:quinone reductase
MRAAWYEKQGPAREVLVVGEMPEPHPSAGEVRIRIAASVEAAFGANIDADVEMLKMGGSIGAYATDTATPKIPFWLMVFKNIGVFFLGSDDFPAEAKVAATRDLNDALQAGWAGFEIGECIPLAEIARAHELVEHPVRRGRVVVTV